MAGRSSKAVATAPKTAAPASKTRSVRRGPLRATGRSMSSTRALMNGTAEVYEAVADSARLPRAPSMSPSQMAARRTKTRRMGRWMHKNDGILRQGVSTLGVAVVGTGPMPRTPFRELLPLWREYCKQTDPTGKKHFGGQLKAGFEESIFATDTIVRMRERRLTDGLVVPMQLQFLPAEFLPEDKTETLPGGRQIINGVEIDGRGAPAAYWLYQQHPDDARLTGKSTQLTRVDAADILHICEPGTQGDYRGESTVVGAMLNLYRLHGYMDAEMSRKRAVAAMAGFIKDAKDRDPQWVGQDNPDEEAQSLIDVLELEFGMLIQLPSSTDISFPQAQDASGNAVAFIRLLGLIISAAIGAPYELIFGDWAQATDRTAVFSSTYFDQYVETKRQDLQKQVCDPLWHRFVDLCVATGLWTPPANLPQWRWYEVTWSWPVRGYKHPLQDVQAKKTAVEAGFLDADTVILEGGGDADETMLRRMVAIARKKAYGLALSETEALAEETPFYKRIYSVVSKQVEKLVAAMEDSSLDEGVLDE